MSCCWLLRLTSVAQELDKAQSRSFPHPLYQACHLTWTSGLASLVPCLGFSDSFSRGAREVYNDKSGPVPTLILFQRKVLHGFLKGPLCSTCRPFSLIPLHPRPSLVLLSTCVQSCVFCSPGFVLLPLPSFRPVPRCGFFSCRAHASQGSPTPVSCTHFSLIFFITLAQWFSTLLMLQPINTVPCVVTPQP